MLVTRSVVTWSRWYLKKCSDLIRNASIVDISNARWIKYLPRENYGTKSRVSKRLSILETNHITIFQETILFATTALYLPSTITNIDSIDIAFYIILGMKSWDLHVCDRASTITHVDRVKKSNPWYNKIWLCLNVTIWSSQICFSVIFIHFVMIQNIWEKNCTYSHFFQSPVTASAYFGRL